MKNRKKKRFKLIKVKRKPKPKKERPFVQALIDYLMREFKLTEPQAKVNAFAIMVKCSNEGLLTKTDFLKGGVILRPRSCNSEYVVSNHNLSDVKESVVNATKECAERLKVLAEIEFLNQNHKPT